MTVIFMSAVLILVMLMCFVFVFTSDTPFRDKVLYSVFFILAILAFMWVNNDLPLVVFKI